MSVIFKGVITKLGVDSLEFKFQALPVNVNKSGLAGSSLPPAEHDLLCVFHTYLIVPLRYASQGLGSN